MTTQCQAGICRNSLLIPGSAAVGARNVIALLRRSNPDVVAYPGQSVCYASGAGDVQPCGMHGDYRGCPVAFDHAFKNTICLHDSPKCMDGIILAAVANKLRHALGALSGDEEAMSGRGLTGETVLLGRCRTDDETYTACKASGCNGKSGCVGNDGFPVYE